MTTLLCPIFKLKAGQTAVFEEVPVGHGKFYVQELIKEADRDQYMTREANGGYSSDIKVNQNAPIWQGLIKWTGRTYFASEYDASNPEIGPYQTVWYGASGPITDTDGSSVAFAYEHQNGVYEDRLASLSITKELTSYGSITGQTYKINVELDGESLPEGTTYTVGSETRTVGFDESGNSYVELAGGETAVISNILSGTAFHVWEAEASAKGHTVTYTNNSASGNGEDIVVGTDGVTGIIRVFDHVQLTVSNVQHGTELTIPVIKNYYKFEGTSYSYTFKLWEMTMNEGATDTTLAASWTQADTALVSKKVTFTQKTTNFDLTTLTYLKSEFDTFPAVKYYMIEETGETSPTVNNKNQFMIEVTITEDSTTGAISAAITKIYQRSSSTKAWAEYTGTTPKFTNKLVGSLTVTKTLEGGSI